MDNIEDDDLTNLAWLRESNSKELQTTGDYEIFLFIFGEEYLFYSRLVECENNHIDDDLQCLCWIIKMRPTAYSSHALKRLSVSLNKLHHYHRSSNRLLSSSNAFNCSLGVVQNVMTHQGNFDNHPVSRRVLMLRTFNNHVSSTKSCQQSSIMIRSSNGKISYLSIRHFV
ncbi:unnamed protein product [Rotaria socialis]|uniref:Uncharacterized protein n=1 Tax=Rotaria socialis TaxID=392032 RepID=A0A820DC92_9BILA|nr:unnamed protein product [Rotaria socialis]CAF3639616.1 unnamed protein product [Rotaria socialis]CAF4229882.1 unnamed protein product [Rotaria socialis]CAF4291179.1 unnamed protein product [Rotaria socialis]CAF4514493.1 unnamed protein product [Rotaria socialis]